MMSIALEMSQTSWTVNILRVQTVRWGGKRLELYAELLQVGYLESDNSGNKNLAMYAHCVNLFIQASVERCTEEHTNKTVSIVTNNATNLTAGRYCSNYMTV